LIFARLDRVNIKHGRYGISISLKPTDLLARKNPSGMELFLEESTRNGQVELAIGDASIYEEEEWEYCLGVCGKVTR